MRCASRVTDVYTQTSRAEGMLNLSDWLTLGLEAVNALQPVSVAVRFVPSASLSSLGAFAAAYTVPIKEFISILPPFLLFLPLRINLRAPSSCISCRLCFSICMRLTQQPSRTRCETSRQLRRRCAFARGRCRISRTVFWRRASTTKSSLSAPLRPFSLPYSPLSVSLSQSLSLFLPWFAVLFAFASAMGCELTR
jgi:hypothetical protein